MARGSLAILSTENLLHNLSVIKARAPGAQILAMVKANAYGHGLRSVSLRLEKQVDGLGVACIEEAVALRKVGIKIPITLMEGVFEPDELLIAACEKFPVVFHEPTQLEWLARAVLPIKIVAWLKVDTGLGRLGFSLDQAAWAYEQLARSPHVVQPIGIMSHFGCADLKDHPANQLQQKRFMEFVAGKPGPKSFSNSAALFQFPDAQYEVIRPGAALYGVSPIAGVSAADLGLKPVMTMQTRLIAVRFARRGSTIGYGARYTCPEDMPIGVIAMGYGDGLPRTTRDGAPVLVNGRRCAFVGRVSMDMAMIDLRNCSTARVGDLVVLWGEGMPLEELAQFTDHIAYDILTGVQPRIKFHWTLNA